MILVMNIKAEEANVRGQRRGGANRGQVQKCPEDESDAEDEDAEEIVIIKSI